MKKLLAAICGAVVMSTSWAAQDDYPNKTIKIVVPYPAGGTIDYIARTVGQGLSSAMGVTVIVENKSGAGGTIGAGDVARARPDGYTLLMTVPDSVINSAAMFKSLSYQPEKDFVPITQVVDVPIMIGTPASTNIKSMDDVKAIINNNAGKDLTYTSWGIGSLGHLAMYALNRSLNAEMVHSPQRGEAPIVQDLLSNTVELGIAGIAVQAQHIASGKIVPLGVLGNTRWPGLPHIPTMGELGFNDPIFTPSVWVGMFAPAKTPVHIIEKLAKETQAIIGTPEMKKVLFERDLLVMNTSPEEFAESYKREFKIITEEIRNAGIEIQ